MIKKPTIQKPYWIILNIKRNSIWKDVFLSKPEAENELKYQVSKLQPNQSGKDWVIEERSFWGEEDGLEDF